MNLKKLFRSFICSALLCSTLSTAAATFVGQRSDFRDETIYFAMTTRFYDGDPMNNVCGWDFQNVQIANNDPDWRGDFKGLIDKLDYIKALGFTAVWITPIAQNCSGTDFHGYHAMDFSNVDLRYESRKEWGSAEDVKFQDLIDAAHAKGMKIVLDIVLNHTGNFGEANLQHLFTRSQNIKDQANISASIIPNTDKLPANYNDLPGKEQYAARFPYLKNSNGKNLDNHNYWHHLATNWNWDLPNRWWGQIAGDCVDLNTENPAVAEYLVKCYGKFIEMGVDGFRIDTTGHISRLTFNTSFIPQFLEIAEKAKDKRLNGCPFFMFGECCQRFQGSVIYRNQPNLSSFYYTWKSPKSLTDQWNYDASFWDNIVIMEGDDINRPGNMALCEAEPSVTQTSDNVFMKNGAWHEPDYSQYSGFSIIDFPSHYGFNNAGYVVDLAKGGDKYYNDASYNVVYVDSHDYCPGPNDLTRFNGGTAQWAENLSLMFTFRGIPCIYYGSEVEFQKGCRVDAGGTDTPVKESGRAYFGHYIEGDVTASDFGEYTATGNVAKTLNADLAQHIVRLNKIRAAVPALRKGQYTFDGCSAQGGWAFKRAYKDESYALVAINGGATFSGLPAGTYVDVVTGQSYTPAGGSITVTAPSNKGQLRVLVKDWKGGKVGEDGTFIYTTTSVPKGGSVKFTDPGTTQYYTADDAVGQPTVKFSPAGTSFKTETLTVSATLSESAKTGWYKVGDADAVSLTPGETAQFTIGRGMNYGDKVTVTWGADTYTGKETYRKVDPNNVVTVYVKSPSAPHIYAWETTASGTVEHAGAWPGTKLSATETIDGDTYYYMSFPNIEDHINVIFTINGAGKTPDIKGLTADTFFEYDGNGKAKQLDINPGPKAPVIKANPTDGTQFNGSLTVTLTVSGASDLYYTLDGTQASASSTLYRGPITITQTTTINTYAANEVSTTRQAFTYTLVETPIVTERTVYFDNSKAKWPTVYVYTWTDGAGDMKSWPGTPATLIDATNNIWKFQIPEKWQNMIANNGSGAQTNDYRDGIVHGHLYEIPAERANLVDKGLYNGDAGVGDITIDASNAPIRYYNIQGVAIDADALTPGIYVKRQGNKTSKILVR